MKFGIYYSGKIVYCEVSPCSFKPHYGLQVQMSLVQPACNAESVFVHDPVVRGIADMPTAELRERAEELVLDELAKLEIRQRLVDAPVYWARVKAEFTAENQLAKQREAEQNARLKAAGFTHLFTGWVHPEQGDDYPVRKVFNRAPSVRDIAALLKHSVVKTDYKVEQL